MATDYSCDSCNKSREDVRKIKGIEYGNIILTCDNCYNDLHPAIKKAHVDTDECLDRSSCKNCGGTTFKDNQLESLMNHFIPYTWTCVECDEDHTSKEDFVMIEPHDFLRTKTADYPEYGAMMRYYRCNNCGKEKSEMIPEEVF